MPTKKKQKTSLAAQYRPGDKVRVRHGVNDADYPDMPLGGWAGTIAEAHDDGIYTVRWSRQTLDAIHPVFKKRCEKDGLEFELYRLQEDDLQPDEDGPLSIEQPQQITTKPLSPNDQDDRIRMILGLTSNDPLPDVDDEMLEVFHQHLLQMLVFPFTAEYRPEYGRREQVKVIGLGDPEDDPMIDDMYGILGEARMEGRTVTLPLGELEDAEGKPNRQLVEDYGYWFHNW